MADNSWHTFIVAFVIVLVLASVVTGSAFATPTPRFGLGGADEGASISWNNYVWKNPPDWGWEKVFGTSDVMGGRLGVDNHETYTETTHFGLNITGPTSNIWAAPMVNKTNGIVFLGHTDACNHANWASPHACESHSGPGTYGNFNENFHEMAYPGLVHLHDMNGDGYISCLDNGNSTHTNCGSDPLNITTSRYAPSDGIWLDSPTNLGNFIQNNPGKAYIVGHEYQLSHQHIAPQILAYIWKEYAEFIRSKDSTAKVYFGDFAHQTIQYTCTTDSTQWNNPGYIPQGECNLITDFTSDGNYESWEYLLTAAKKYKAITTSNERPDGFHIDAAVTWSDPDTRTTLKSNISNWGGRTWNAMANFAAYEIQDPIDFLGRNASEFHHTATSTSTNYGADGYTTYYGWDRNGNGSVDWYDANGDSKIDLQSGEYDERCPSWSPFSRYVKYISGSGPYYTCDLNPDAGGRYWYDENTSFDVIVHQGVGRDADTATADREEHMFAMALAQQLISHWAYNTGISDSVTNKWSYKYWLMRDFYFAPDANDSVNPCGAGEFSMADADATSSTVLSPVGLVYEKAVEDQNFTWWGSGTWNASSGSCFASESWPARPNSQLPSGW